MNSDDQVESEELVMSNQHEEISISQEHELEPQGDDQEDKMEEDAQLYVNN